MIKKAALLVFSCLGIFGMSFMVQDDFNSYLKQLQNYLNQQVNEKIYLQLDKPYYAIGDDIWFKAYISTTEGGLSDLSKVLYVELINENNQVVKSAKLPIQLGLSWGEFQLDDKLQEGNYRVRAYTQYMRNFDDAFFFNKTIHVGQTWSNDVFVKTQFERDQTNGNKIMIANSTFTDKNQQPLVKTVVNYQVQMDGVEVINSNGKTNENGVLSFDINYKNPKIASKKSGVITYTFSDVNGKKLTRFAAIQNLWLNDFQFFPESGNLITGIESVVAFKATQASGKGIHVKGTVINQNGETITTFEDSHLGMGYFQLQPKAGETYTAQITYENGDVQKINLPTAKNSGVVLHVAKDAAQNFKLNIQTSEDMIGKPIKVVATSNGLICYASKTQLKNNHLMAGVSKDKFPSGIVTFTVLGADYLPLAERIAFNKNDTSFLDLKAENLNASYEQKEKMNLKFKVELPHKADAVGSYSVAVTNSDVVKPDIDNESNILTSLLLTSDIKGYVENPNYYFNAANPNTDEALDQLLLTQGWRNFDWKMVSASTEKPKLFPIEKGITLQGSVTRGKYPVAKGKLSIFSNKDGIFIIDTTTDMQGRFALTGLEFTDTARFLVQARTQTNKKYVDVKIDDLGNVPISYNYQNADNVLNVNDLLKGYVSASEKYFDEMTKRGFLQKTIVLEGVTVVGQREEDKPSQWNLSGSYDYKIKQDVLQNCFSLLQCLQGRVPGLMVQNNQFYLMRYLSNRTPMQIYLDGMPIESDFLQSIVPQNVESIEVLSNISNTAIYGSRGVGGVLIINSKRGANAFNANDPAPGIATTLLKGFTLVRNFYQPNYDNPSEIPSNFVDNRNTIFWKPDLVSTEDGTLEISYFNAAVPAHYRMVIEGMSLSGKYVRKVFEYEVN